MNYFNLKFLDIEWSLVTFQTVFILYLLLDTLSI